MDPEPRRRVAPRSTTPSPRRAIGGLVLALSLAVGACSGVGSAADPGAPRGGAGVDDPFSGGGGGGGGGNVSVLVQNNNDNYAELVGLDAGGQTRLGVVAPGEQEIFDWRIPGEGEVAIGIRLRNGESHTTSRVRAEPGRQLNLRISRILTSSTLRR